MIAVFAVVTATLSLATALPAQAAPGDAYDPSQPQVFVAQTAAGATQLYRSVTDASGVTSFEPEGASVPFGYNAIAFNPGDGYIYGIASESGADVTAGQMIRIGEAGIVTGVGAAIHDVTDNVGLIGADGYLYAGNGNNSSSLSRIDTATGAVVGTLTLSEVPVVSDITVVEGYFWGVENFSNEIVRIDPTSGVVTRFADVLPAETTAGSVWTYGNGNFGIKDNGSGAVYQVTISDSASDAPGFTIVSVSQGPGSANADGTAIPGLPVDLEVVKVATPLAEAGGEITYTLTVTNNGPGDSSGYSVSDSIPSGLTDVVAADPSCSITGGVVTCLGGPLALGESADFTITANAPVPFTEAISNTASVTGNEEDPDPSNDTSTDMTGPSDPALAIVKTADEAAQDGIVVGQEVTYSFLVTNTGNVTLTDVGVVEGEFSGTGELSDVVCPAEAAELAPSASVTCSATYTVTQADVDAGSITNDATSTGTPPVGDPITSVPSESEVPAVSEPALSIVKTADVQEISTVGQEITFSFLITNTGTVTVSDPSVVEGEFSGTGELSGIDCPADAVLAPGQQVTCTATYQVTQADLDAGDLTNTATAVGTTPSGDPTDPSDPSTVEVPTDPQPALTVVKTADESSVVGVGQAITYTFVVTNTGNVTIEDAHIVETDFSGSGELSAIHCEDGAAALAPGARTACTATYTTTQADVRAGRVSNSAVASGTPVTGGDPVASPPSTVSVDITSTGGLAVTGGELAAGIVGIAFLLLIAGGTLMTIRRRRGESLGE